MGYSINFELTLVLGIVFVTLLIIIYLSQKSRRRNKRIQQDYETLALAKEISCDTRNPHNLKEVGLPELYVKHDGDKVIAGEVRTIVLSMIGLLIIFAGMAFYLFRQQQWYAAGAVIFFAIVASIYLAVSIKKVKRSGKGLLPLKQQVEEYENHFDQMVSEVNKTQAIKASPSRVTQKYRKPLDELLQLAEKFSAVVPQDSTLKRHFMTQLLTTAEETLGERPTDSTLKRHYDQLLDTKLLQALEKLAEPDVVQRAVVAKSIVVEKKRVPEDSTLRRHFLTELRFKLEERLGMPKPTDFNLRRHYETLVQSLLEKELEDHYS